METIHNTQLFEIVDYEGKPICNHFINRKSLNKSLEIYQKNDPHFHENHRVFRYEVLLGGQENIEPPKQNDEA